MLGMYVASGRSPRAVRARWLYGTRRRGACSSSSASSSIWRSSATSCAGRCWRRSSRPSASRCCCATPPSGYSRQFRDACRNASSGTSSISAASSSACRSSSPASSRSHSTLGMHLLLTRTALGSRILAVAEDRNAAMLMGIRPDRMQALAWGLAARERRDRRRADRDLLFHLADGRARPLALTAFVVVALGGFGSVPGAMIAASSSASSSRSRPIISVRSTRTSSSTGSSSRCCGCGRRASWGRRRCPGAGRRLGGSGGRARLLYPLVSVPTAPLSTSSMGAWSAARARSAPRPGTSSAAMPGRSRSATRCSSAPAPICRCSSTRSGRLPPLLGLPLGIAGQPSSSRSSSACRPSACTATISAWRRSRSPS